MYLTICAYIQVFSGKFRDFIWLSESFIVP